MMKEILITSSALILALLLLRRVFRGVLSRRIQYALWGLVLLRLLVPVSFLPAAEFSVLSATAPARQAVERQLNSQLHYSRPVERISPEELLDRNISLSEVPTAEEGSAMILMEPPTPGSDISLQQRGYLVRDAETNAVTLYRHMSVGPWEVLSAIWKTGMALMGCFFLVSNLGFYWRLRKHRREWRAQWSRPTGSPSVSCVGPDDPAGQPARKVYLVPDGVIPSPCLFGRSIYITPAVAEDENKLRHVLCHEETHARHWDPVWSLLRCVCLTVYWFDPLVWVAAACAKTDCELACDESVLEKLGEAERIPYGQTLVSLIPVKRTSNPMIAATTMTAGKKQLKDRVTRIAQKPRQLMAAALAVAVLAVTVSACTFTAGTSEGTVSPSPAPVESGQPDDNALRPLTGEELRWFNEEFFNYHPIPEVSNTYTIRNQFINSAFNLYDRPEDIDLYQLFYCDGSILSDAEYRAVYGQEEMLCPAFKLTAEEMDGILQEYTGLTLAQTNMVGLENFTYRDGAYYWMHGDTNYPGNIEILYGTREGSTVKLYHHGWNSGSEWYCVTLTDRGDGQYWFVSNQTCERPVISTPLPAWEPEKTVSFRDLTPYAAPAVTVEPHVGDFDNSYENRLENWDFDGHNVVIYRATDGKIYAALRQEDDTMNVFLTLPTDDCSLFFYNDLLGHSGFYIKYVGSTPGDYYSGGEGSAYGTIYEYFYIDEGGVPVRLLRNPSSGSAQLDLNGDGQDELLGSGGFFFQQDGQIYLAALTQQDNLWPGQIENMFLDPYGKYFTVRGYTGDYKEWTRYVYFDGENILVYKNEKPTHDHMVDGVDEGVPAPVVAEARDYVERVYVDAEVDRKEAELGRLTGTQDPGEPLPEYDNWRLDYFDGPYTYSHGGATVEGWQFNYELHTTTPENIVLAGGKYITEDNWVSPGYPGCDTLFFEVKDGKYHYLNYRMVQEGMYSYYIQGVVLQLMEDQGVELPDGSTYAQLNFQKHLDHLTDHTEKLRVQYDDGQGGGGAYLVGPQEGNGPYYLGQMKDNSTVWSWAQVPNPEPQGPSVTLSSEDWYEAIRFWRDSGLVMYKQENRDPRWFQVQYDGDPAQDVFSYRAVPYYWARCWFDDGEYVRYSNTALGDHGDGNYREIAQAYLALYEEAAKLNATPGSSYACTFVKVTDVEILEDQPESWFPAEVLAYPHFAFSYDVIFVPENEDALYSLMAGNTGEYGGNDPTVPQGAFEYSRRGAMYLKDGYWYCAGVGTG